MQNRIGANLGRYEILGVIGRGTMGTVYKARDPKIDREVAIKTISLLGLDNSDLDSDNDGDNVEDEYRQRFFQEARAAGRMSHSGIVTIFDVGEDPESRDPYIVMEYVAGHALDRYLGRSQKRIPLSVTLRLVQEVAEALDYAHRQEVIHRDIKPANLLITGEGHPKIADFGIAKLNRSQLTMPGHMIGSPAYMAPEQLSGEAADGRSDLFSLGVILYTMLAGHRPFQGNSTATVAFKLANRDPLPVTSFQSDLPEEINELVLRAIAKDPADRFQTGAEMAQTVQRFRERHEPLNQPAGALTLVDTIAPVSSKRRIQPAADLPPQPGPENPPSTSTFTRLKPVMLKGKIASATGLAIATVVVMTLLRHGKTDSAQPTLPQAANLAPISPPPGADKVSILARISAAETPPSGTTAANDDGVKPAVPKTPAVRTRARKTLAAKTPAPSTDLATTVDAKIPEAELDIQIEHRFSAGDVSIWLDRTLVYSHDLIGERTKHAVLFTRTKGLQSATAWVTPGKHELRVWVKSPSESYDQVETVPAELTAGKLNTLLITCDKKHLQVTFR